MQEIITGLEKTFNLYKPPDRIGDIILSQEIPVKVKVEVGK